MSARASLAIAILTSVTVAVSVIACSAVPSATDTLTVRGPSLADFSAVQGGVSAVFERHCGSVDCHGNEAQPMRIYSQYGLRLPVGFSTVNEPVDAGTSGDGGDSGTITLPPSDDDEGGVQAMPGDVPTTADEVLANYESIISLEPRVMQAVVKNGDPYQLLILKKPLLIEPHKGGPALSKNGDGETCIVGWLKGAANPTACTAASKLP